jgi:hypothetical protein
MKKPELIQHYFNAMKSCALLITNKRSFDSPKLEMNGIGIKLEKCAKYLGVYIDQKLNWNQHIDYIYNQTLKIIQNNNEDSHNIEKHLGSIFSIA